MLNVAPLRADVSNLISSLQPLAQPSESIRRLSETNSSPITLYIAVVVLMGLVNSQGREGPSGFANNKIATVKLFSSVDELYTNWPYHACVLAPVKHSWCDYG